MLARIINSAVLVLSLITGLVCMFIAVTGMNPWINGLCLLATFCSAFLGFISYTMLIGDKL